MSLEGAKRGLHQPRVYSSTRMFDAPAVFASANLSSHLRQLQPSLIRVSTDDGPPALLDLELGSISGPEKLGLPARAREMGIFNPSLAKAPPSLCPRCAYVALVRVDPLHQCHDLSPLLKPDPGMPKNTAANAWFKGTALAALDKELRVLGWTWLLNAPQHQVPQQPTPSRWFVPVGASDRFPPPWAKAVYDVRIVSIAERLFVSYVCRRCDFSVAQLQVTAEHTADGGLRSMRAWQSRRYSSTESWAQGRNQALFVAPRKRGGGDELLVQPWMSVVASFGAPRFAKQTIQCGGKGGGTRTCGATPHGTTLELERVSNERSSPRHPEGFGALELISEASHPLLGKSAVGGFRLSTTSNLVPLTRTGSAADGCMLHLGVGHVHRSEGELNIRMKMLQSGGGRRRRRRAAGAVDQTVDDASSLSSGMVRNSSSSSSSSSRASLSSQSRTFMWGFHYTHFFYALEPYAPFGVVATSHEFCLQSEQNASDCESIQFVSGLLHAVDLPRPTLLLSYGINDCEAKVGKISVDRVWRMLKPLPQLAGSATAAAAQCFGSERL